MSNDTKSLLSFYVFSALLVMFMFGSFYTFDYLSEMFRAEYIETLDGEQYTFPEDHFGYAHNLVVDSAYVEAKNTVEDDVFGRGPNLIWVELLDETDVAGVGVYVEEGKDEQGNIVIGLFADKEFTEDVSYYESGGIRYSKPLLVNKEGEHYLLAIARLKYTGPNLAKFNFDAGEWREIVTEHYRNII